MTRGNPNLQERSLHDSLFWRKEENSFTNTLLILKEGEQHTNCNATELSSNANYKDVHMYNIYPQRRTHGMAGYVGVQPVQSPGALH